ncbi:hypothetical protein EFB08_06020 [Rufibacter latericius]|uniref:Uncharacterized protein n=1 Tax=Rufibacter latericius TaxID=2487040 RepID=A0A3M9MU15_9BACT|nr:hypothetical protein EFB08_06020 [Rufibacter latericius]
MCSVFKQVRKSSYEFAFGFKFKFWNIVRVSIYFEIFPTATEINGILVIFFVLHNGTSEVFF